MKTAHLVIIVDIETQQVLGWDIWSRVDSKRPLLVSTSGGVFAASVEEARRETYQEAHDWLMHAADTYLARVLRGTPMMERRTATTGTTVTKETT